MADLSELMDEEITSRVKAKLIPELIEWMARNSSSIRDVSVAEFPNGAQFNFAMGVACGQQALREALEEMLAEANNPETRFLNDD